MRALNIILKLLGFLIGSGATIALIWGLFYICGIPFVVEGTDKIFNPPAIEQEQPNEETETPEIEDPNISIDKDNTTLARVNFDTHTIFVEV